VSIKPFGVQDVIDGLNFYLDEIKADMLHVDASPDFFQKIFNGVKQKQMAFIPNPLLDFHAMKKDPDECGFLLR